MRNRTSDLRIPRSDALPLSHRDSTMSEVYNKVHMTHVLLTAWISNVDSVMKSLLFLQAGQATEPECLVALGLAAGEDGQVCCKISSS